MSLLITTYHGTPANYFRDALLSVAGCYPRPSQIVIVFDGPSTHEQEAVVEEMLRHPSLQRIDVVKLGINVGSGAAANAGLAECDQEWIARLDSDDLCLPTRFAQQWAAIENDPTLDLVCGWQLDFSSQVGDRQTLKTVPELHGAIMRAMKWRCCISHPSIIVRREALEAVGGYWPHSYVEDYDLFFRLATYGARFYAVQAPVVAARVSVAQLQRRTGWSKFLLDVRFRARCFRRGDLNLLEFLLSIGLYAAFRLTPPRVKPAFYNFSRRRLGARSLPDAPYPAVT